MFKYIHNLILREYRFLFAGALPHWINEIPDMKVRSSTPAWKNEMSRFFKDIVELAKPYLADNGGPIILSQVENEFFWVDPDYM